METLTEQEQESLSHLEARVAKAVELVTELRAERDAAKLEANAAKEDCAKLRTQLEKLESERNSFQSERKAVRTRIEKLLGQMDLLSSDS